MSTKQLFFSLVLSALLLSPVSQVEAEASDYIIRVNYDGPRELYEVDVLLFDNDRACNTLTESPTEPPSEDAAWTSLVILPDAEGDIPDRPLNVPTGTEFHYAVARATASDGAGGGTSYFVTFGCNDQIPMSEPAVATLIEIDMHDLWLNVVVPTGDPSQDAANVQAAVEASLPGDIVHLASGDFNFGGADSIVISKSVIIEGEAIDGPLGTRLIGGDVVFDILAPGGPVTIRDLWIKDPITAGVRVTDAFDTTIESIRIEGSGAKGVWLAPGDGASTSTIERNDLRRLTTALHLQSANNTVVARNIIASNGTGIDVDTSGNRISHNVIVNNDVQVTSVLGNDWTAPEDDAGNFWSDYWGVDTNGDQVGDTELPHQALDPAPLLDPSIPEQFGSYLCADWWSIWEGSWSAAEVSLVGPLGGRIDATQNQIGDHAYYTERDQEGERVIRTLVHRPCTPEAGLGTYSLEMTALADLDYDLSIAVTEAGTDLYRRVEEAQLLSAGESRQVGIEIEEMVDPATGGITVAVESVDNEAPSVNDVWLAPSVAPVGGAVSLTATIDDTASGGSNIASAEYSIEDGEWLDMQPSDGAFDQNTEDVESDITAPSLPGVYEVCLRGMDTAGNVGEKECAFLVAYDPAGGFVTGGGWIDSLQGAYAPDPTLIGKASFGFVSKYKKGASVPTGNTEFQFKVADLDFKSTIYEWLVIAGSKAQFKGEGTINGGGLYRFMLTANDEPDTFRIRIWMEDETTAEEIVVYDNGVDQYLGGGSVVIHKSQ